MRPSCLDCARKHLAQADILMMEAATGDYPEHVWYAVGHMAEAADELMDKWPKLAEKVRLARVAYIDDGKKVKMLELIAFVSSHDIAEEITEPA